MILRAGTGWQTMLADLSMILFMITAAALTQAPAPGAAKARAPANVETTRPSPRSEPMAVYIAAPDAPSLSEWLAAQPRDPRQQLTITARYGAGGQGAAVAMASQMAQAAGAAGLRARIVVEPGEGPARAALAYDVPDAAGT